MKILDWILLKSGFIDEAEEILDDTEHPSFQELCQIRKRVFTALTLEEEQQYENLQWIDRTMFVRKKVLQLIQK